MIDSSVKTAEIDGPFVAGANITTKPSGQDPIKGKVTEVEDGHRAIIEISLPGAILRCFWTYEDSGGGTRITQRMAIEGERAADYTAMGETMEQTLPLGMKRVAETISQSYKQKYGTYKSSGAERTT